MDFCTSSLMDYCTNSFMDFCNKYLINYVEQNNLINLQFIVIIRTIERLIIVNTIFIYCAKWLLLICLSGSLHCTQSFGGYSPLLFVPSIYSALCVIKNLVISYDAYLYIMALTWIQALKNGMKKRELVSSSKRYREI